MSSRSVMRKDLKMNDPVSVEAPAYVWYGFIVWYSHHGGTSMDTSRISNAAAEKIADPLFLKEQEALHHEQANQDPLVSFLGRFGAQPYPEDPE
jgi:hypothetical protein